MSLQMFGSFHIWGFFHKDFGVLVKSLSVLKPSICSSMCTLLCTFGSLLASVMWPRRGTAICCPRAICIFSLSWVFATSCLQRTLGQRALPWTAVKRQPQRQWLFKAKHRNSSAWCTTLALSDSGRHWLPYGNRRKWGWTMHWLKQNEQ